MTIINDPELKKRAEALLQTIETSIENINMCLGSFKQTETVATEQKTENGLANDPKSQVSAQEAETAKVEQKTTDDHAARPQKPGRISQNRIAMFGSQIGIKTQPNASRDDQNSKAIAELKAKRKAQEEKEKLEAERSTI